MGTYVSEQKLLMSAPAVQARGRKHVLKGTDPDTRRVILDCPVSEFGFALTALGTELRRCSKPGN
jgi:hypothetical protein